MSEQMERNTVDTEEKLTEAMTATTDMFDKIIKTGIFVAENDMMSIEAKAKLGKAALEISETLLSFTSEDEKYPEINDDTRMFAEELIAFVTRTYMRGSETVKQHYKEGFHTI